MPNGPTPDLPRPESEGVPSIPDYELIRIIGRGSYGDVWLAKGLTGVYRAIKIIWRDRFQDARPYEREFRGLTEFATISIHQPSQLALLHAGRNETFFFYVMELADDVDRGRDIVPETYVPLTLKHVRERRGGLPAAECVSIGVELARSLAGMHARNLVHRDIKPSNIIFVSSVPKLADIGLVATASGALTFVGTEGFVPPEGPGTPAADVYSLGKVLYEMATGLDRNEYPRLSPDLRKATDRQALLELNEVIICACNPDPTARYQDAQLLLDELLLLQAGRSVRRMHEAERHLARTLRFSGILAIVAALAGTGAWIEHTRLGRETSRRIKAEATLESLARQTLYSANLNRAQWGLETGEYGFARRVLAELNPKTGEPDQRGFEWKVFWDQAQGDSADVARIPGRSIDRLCSSASGRLLAGRIDDQSAVIWEASTLKPIVTIEGVYRIGGISPDDRWLFGTDSSNRFCRWAIQTGEVERQEAQPAATERPVGPTDSESILSLGSNDSAQPRFLRIWNYGQKKAALVLPVAIPDPSGWEFALSSLSRDRRLCVVVLSRYTRPPLYLWRVQAYDLLKGRLLFDREMSDRVTAVALSSDGKSVAYALADSSQICLDEIASGSTRWKKNAGLGVARAIAYSPDDRRVIIGGRVSSLLIVDSEDGRSLETLEGQEASVNEVVWDGSTQQIFSAGSAGDLRHWRPDAPRKIRSFPGFFSVSFSTQPLCVSDDGRYFSAPISKNTLAWGVIDSPRRLATNLIGQIPLGFDHDGKGLSAIDEEGAMLHYRLDSNGRVRVDSNTAMVDPDVGIEDAVWSHDHKTLVVAGRNGSVHFLNLATGGHSVYSGFRRGGIGWANISPDGRAAITGGIDHTVRLWRVPTGSLSTQWSYNTIPFYAAVSSDNSIVAVCLMNGEVEIRNLDDGRLVTRFRSDFSVLESLAFLPDGKRLFLGGPNGSVQALDCFGWRPLVTLNVPGGPDAGDRTIARLAVSADGTTLMAYRADGLLAAWRYNP